MTLCVPEHVKRNHEAVDTAMISFEGVFAGLMLAYENLPATEDQQGRAWEAFDALLLILEERMQQVMHLRTLEWIGMGGTSSNLPDFTPAEVARARGEAAPEGMMSVPLLKETAN